MLQTLSESREMEEEYKRRLRKGIGIGCRGGMGGSIGREVVGANRWSIVSRKMMRSRLKKFGTARERGNRKRVEQVAVKEVEVVVVALIWKKLWE